MSVRAALNQVALKINPPPRNLHESREIYRSLRKYGEIDMYRNLRHEISTLEPKEDAIVLFRTRAAIDGLLAASPLIISVPPVSPSPIPSAGEANHVNTEPPPIESFKLDVSESDYSHESKIIHQLVGHMHSPYSVNQEAPPGVSLNFSTRTNLSRVSGATEYKETVSKATNGGWYSWRMEMKQAGIPNWSAIKPTVDVTGMPREPAAPVPRSTSVGWSRPAGSRDLAKQIPVRQPPPARPVSISNPTPLPVDPTLQSQYPQSALRGVPGSAQAKDGFVRWRVPSSHSGTGKSFLPNQSNQVTGLSKVPMPGITSTQVPEESTETVSGGSPGEARSTSQTNSISSKSEEIVLSDTNPGIINIISDGDTRSSSNTTSPLQPDDYLAPESPLESLKSGTVTVGSSSSIKSEPENSNPQTEDAVENSPGMVAHGEQTQSAAQSDSINTTTQNSHSDNRHLRPADVTDEKLGSQATPQSSSEPSTTKPQDPQPSEIPIVEPSPGNPEKNSTRSNRNDLTQPSEHSEKSWWKVW